MSLKLFPDEIIYQYNLHSIAKDDWVYCKIRKGMPGLKQAGKIANERLKKHLANFGYASCKFTAALWKHNIRNITFTLVVDDFGIKYVSEKRQRPSSQRSKKIIYHHMRL